MAFYIAAELSRPAFRTSEFQGAGNARDITRSNPVLLLLRLVLESAFVDMQKISNGSPTSEALAAAEWVNAELDYSRPGVPKPPEELRHEAVMSFCWVCHHLDLDPETIRMSGLRHIRGLSHHSGRWLPGLPEVYERWRQAREQHEGQHTQPLQQQQEAMAASV